MSDLNGIVIPVDTKQVVDAINKTKALEGSIVKLFNSYTQGNITQKQFSEGLRSLNKDYAALGASVPKSTAVIRGYAKELQLAKTAQDNLTAAKKRAETAFALGIQRAEEEQKAIAQSRKETEAWFAQQRRRLDMMRNSEAMATQAANGYKGYGFAVQQAGYQVGDFFVQVQSGTNALVAFGQQATQLVYIIPAMAAEMNLAKITFMGISMSVGVLTAALGIIIPIVTMLGAAWMRTSEDSVKAIDKQKQAVDSLKDSITSLREEREREAAGLQTTDELTVQKEINQLIRERAQLQKSIDFAGSENQVIASQGRSLNVQKTLEAEQELKQVRIDELNALIKELEYERQLETAAKRRANDTRDRLKAEFDANQRQEESLRHQYEYYAKSRTESDALVTAVNDALANGTAGDFQTAMQDALDAGITFSELDLSSPVIKAMNAAGQLATMMYTAMNPAVKPFIPSSGLGMAPQISPLAPGASPRPGERPFELGVPIIPTTTNGGGGSTQQTFDDYIKALEQETAQKQKMIGLYGQSAEIEKARYDAAKAMNTTVDKLTTKEIERIDALAKQNYMLEQQEAITQTAYNSIHDALMGLVDGTKSVQDAFKDMLRSILKSMWEQMVANPLAGAGSSLMSGIMSGLTGMPQANGGVWYNGSIQPFATGGVVGSPTLFPMAGGKTGLMGEAGPEAIMPLKRGPDGKLGVASSGGGNVTVNNVINVTGTGDAAYVRSEVAKLMPQITGATKAAVIDARKRGGQMASAFR